MSEILCEECCHPAPEGIEKDTYGLCPNCADGAWFREFDDEGNMIRSKKRDWFGVIIILLGSLLMLFV